MSVSLSSYLVRGEYQHVICSKIMSSNSNKISPTTKIIIYKNFYLVLLCSMGLLSCIPILLIGCTFLIDKSTQLPGPAATLFNDPSKFRLFDNAYNGKLSGIRGISPSVKTNLNLNSKEEAEVMVNILNLLFIKSLKLFWYKKAYVVIIYYHFCSWGDI